MDRRSFLQNVGLVSTGVAFAPLMPLAASKRTIYKVSMPVFEVFYWKRDNDGKMLWNSIIRTVRSYKGTLKQLLDSHPNDEIFFYQELTTEIFPGNKNNIVRAAIMAKEPGVHISTTDIHRTIV
jgi:hypothetical protein